ncbi:hypothetical protein MACJ_000827 [Theileria orientalis]|uniref:Uncharacterized protein n=1 Tax=Theileria orientalis TaxID=68886 RepID=A0A976M4R3_THEOR|nr:hypothetical protein MACJ_000827 [Theileria orientalis]
MRISGSKKNSKKLDESFFHSLGNGVASYNDSELNKPIKSLNMSKKRLLLNDSENIGIMCKRKRKVDYSGNTPRRMTSKTILDVLMNRDNCLYEIDDTVLEEYCLLSTPTDRRYQKNMDKHTELNTADLSLISTTDHDSTQNEFDKIGCGESIQSANEETIDLDSEEVVYHDANESLNIETDVSIDHDMEETLERDIDDELVKCVMDKEYFERLESLPAVVPSEKGIKIFSDVLSPSIGNLTVDGSLKYKLFVLNVSIQILKEDKLNADDLFGTLLSVLKSSRGENGIFSESGRERSKEKELFVSILDNCIYIIRYLNLDELVELFKEFFSYCYSKYQVDIITLRAHGICKEIVRRLQVDRIQQILKYVAENVVYFNNNVYHNVCKVEATKEISKSQVEKMYNSTNEDINVEKRIEMKNELGNRIFVNVVTMLFERIFIGCVKDKEGTLISEVYESVLAREDEESYFVFKEVLKKFIDEAFYKETVEFENYKKFIQMLLANLEIVTQIFTPFLVLEMARVFMAYLNYEGAKSDVDNRVTKSNSRRLHSFKLLMVISTKIFGIYNEMWNALKIGGSNSKYFGNCCNIDGNLQPDTDDVEVFDGKEEGEMGRKFLMLKDYVINYVGYINIDSAHVEWSRMDTYVFYILLKHYCYEANVQKVDDLRLFIKIFKYLYNHNGSYKGDVEKMLKNINYSNVINYPYSPSMSQAIDNDVEGYSHGYNNSYGDMKIEEYILKVYICNGLYELHDGVLDSAVEVMSNTNEHGFLKLSIDFIAEITRSNQSHLLNANIRELLCSSMLDCNTYVRQQIINIYSNCILIINNRDKQQLSISGVKNRDNRKYREQMLKYIDRELLSMIVTCTNDVNYKIRLDSIKLFHCFLSVVGIKDYMDEVSAVAERSLDTNREQPQVKKALYNLLSSVFFKYAIETMDTISEFSSPKTDVNAGRPEGISSSDDTNGVSQCKQLISDDHLYLLGKLVKILLYKMESYKGIVNPIMTMMGYYESNQKVIEDPINWYYQINRTSRQHIASSMNNRGVIGGNSNGSSDNISGEVVKRNSIIKSNVKDKNSKEGLRIERSEEIVSYWLEKLLDLFLYKRAEGCNYYELAEILSVFKQFGEVHPRLFVKHLVYFTPYLRIINDTKLEVNQVNLIILINNLVIMVYKYLKTKKGDKRSIIGTAEEDENQKREVTKNRKTKLEQKNSQKQRVQDDNEKEEEEIFSELNSINNSIMPLVNYNSPILIRSIIHLMSHNNEECIKKIREESYKHLENVKKKLQSFEMKGRDHGKRDMCEDIKERRMRILSNNRMLVDVNMYKNGWQLGCVSEFNEVDSKVMKLFIEMFKLYTEIEVYNISGLFIECCCRYLSNIDNLYKVNHEEFKNMLNELYEYCNEDLRNRFGNLLLILYQLLTTYKSLSSNSEKLRNLQEKRLKDENGLDLNDSNRSSDVVIANSPTDRLVYDTHGKGLDSKTHEKKKQLLKVLYIVMQKYINVFTSKLTNYYNSKSGNTNEPDRENNKIYMDIIEMIVVNRMTSLQEMVPFVFAQLLSTDINVQRVAEQNLKLIIKQDVSVLLTRLNSCFEALLKEIVLQFYEQNYILGVLGKNTQTAVQSIFRIYVEVLERKRANIKMFLTSLLMQTNIINNQEVIESIKGIIMGKSDFNYSNIKVSNGVRRVGRIKRGRKRRRKGLLGGEKGLDGIGSGEMTDGITEVGERVGGVGSTLSNLVTKMKKTKGEERTECVVEYILNLYVNLICVVLDGITFKSKKDAIFAVARIKDVVEKNKVNIKYNKISTMAHTRLKKIARRIKGIYK